MGVTALGVAGVSGFLERAEAFVDFGGCNSLCEFGGGDFGGLLTESLRSSDLSSSAG